MLEPFLGQSFRLSLLSCFFGSNPDPERGNHVALQNTGGAVSDHNSERATQISSEPFGSFTNHAAAA